VEHKRYFEKYFSIAYFCPFNGSQGYLKRFGYQNPSKGMTKQHEDE